MLLFKSLTRYKKTKKENDNDDDAHQLADGTSYVVQTLR